MALLVAVLFAASVLLQIAVPQRRFCADEIPNLAGKTAVVTGANTGLGLETASMLAGAGARVVMACRSLQRCEQARAKIMVRGPPQGRLECWEMDLASLASVSAFGKKFVARCEALRPCAPRPAGPGSYALTRRARLSGEGVDILVNNAGVMGAYGLSQDGFELHFAVNHLGPSPSPGARRADRALALTPSPAGHFLLTKLLMPSIMQRPTARIVSVSSLAHLCDAAGPRLASPFGAAAAVRHRPGPPAFRTQAPRSTWRHCATSAATYRGRRVRAMSGEGRRSSPDASPHPTPPPLPACLRRRTEQAGQHPLRQCACSPRGCYRGVWTQAALRGADWT